MSRTGTSPEHWKRLFALLDTALDLPAAERAAWLDTLDPADAPLRDELARLLERQSDPGFLASLPQFTASPAGATQRALRSAQPGHDVGPYRLIRLLGEGGMASVWLAERADGAFKRTVALKLPHITWSGGLTERLARERDILAGLEHPGIARLYDAGLDALGRPYMAMEYVEGQPIDVYCREHSLGVRKSLQLLLKVLRAVSYAHAHLVVHRDLKPANILVTPDGFVRLLDFGIAKLLASEGSDATQVALRVFTPDYASPEQIRGEPIATSTDVYSLAVVAYELLTLRRPYQLASGSTAELERAIAAADVPPASRVTQDPRRARELRGDLDAILACGLHKDGARRYASVDAFAQDIERHLAGLPVRARPDGAGYRLRKLVARHKTGALAITAVVVALIAGSGVALWQAQVARSQARQSAIDRDIARRAAAREEAVRLYLTRLFRASVADSGAETPTAKTMLDRSAQRVLQQYRDDPYLAGKVVATLADLYGALGDVQGQIPLLEGYLKQAGSEADPEALALVRQKLANVELMRGNADHAEQLLQPAEAFWQRDPLRYAEQRIEGLTVHARLQRERGDIAGSIAKNQEALEQRIALSGVDHPETAILYNSLAIALVAANRTDEALQAYRKALAINEALGRADELDALVMRANLGTLAFRYGQVDEAEKLLKRAIDGQRAQTPGSAALAAAMGIHGSILSARGDPKAAMAQLEEAVRMADQNAGPESPVALQNRGFLADALTASGDLRRASQLIQQTLAAARGKFGDAHPLTQRARLAQARLKIREGDRPGADAIFRDVEGVLRKMGPAMHLALAQVLAARGDLLMSQKRAAEAEPLLAESAAIREKLLWPGSRELAEVREHLAQARDARQVPGT